MRPIPLFKRFYEKVAVSNDCWLWTGARGADGYGNILISKRGRISKHGRAHRVSWMLRFGQNPGRKLVLHRCDTPLCVRPDHLFLGTQLSNVRDMISKGRQKVGGRKFGFGPNDRVPYFTKLDFDKAARIRRLLGIGKSCKEIAIEYGVTLAAISRIKRNKSWIVSTNP